MCIKKKLGCIYIHWYVFIILNLDLSVLGFECLSLKEEHRKAVKDYKAVDFVKYIDINFILGT